MTWKRSNTNCNGNRRDKAVLRTTCNKKVKFNIIKTRTRCQYVGWFYYSENLNWAAQNFRLGRMRTAGRGLDIADLLQHKQSVVETLFKRPKKFPLQPRKWTAKWSMWNGLSCWIFTPNGWFKTKKINNTTDFLSLYLKLFYRTQLTWERL